jgi:hypothetical protein
VKPTPIGWFCIKLRGEKDGARKSLEKEKAENVKTYVWDMVREETDYPFKIPERIAEYEAKDEKGRHDELARVLKEVRPQTSFNISYIPHEHKFHIESSATLGAMDKNRKMEQKNIMQTLAIRISSLVNFVKVSSTCFLRHYHTGTKGIVES